MTDKEYIQRLKREIESLKDLCIELNKTSNKCAICQHTFLLKEEHNETQE